MTGADLEERLGGLLAQTAATRTIDAGRAWRELQLLRSRASRNRRRRLTAALAAAAAVAIVVPAWATHRSGGPGSRLRGGGIDAAAHTRVYPRAIVARIPVSGVVSLVADGPDVWAVRAYNQTWDGSLYQLVKIDARSNKVTLRVNLGSRLQSVAAGAGMVWLTTGHGQALGQLVRLDPATGVVIATVHLAAGRCDLITVSSGSLWAECSEGGFRTEFLRINPGTGLVTGRAGPVRGFVGSIAAAPGGIWFAYLYSASYGLVRVGTPHVSQITVRTSAVAASFGGPQPLVYGQGFVWVLSSDESLAKIDTVTGRVLRIYTYRTYDPGKSGGLDFLTAGNGSLWFLDDGYPFSGVLRVSIATGQPLGAVAEPKSGDCGQAPCSQIYSTPGAIWVPTAERLIRIDPARLPS